MIHLALVIVAFCVICYAALIAFSIVVLAFGKHFILGMLALFALFAVAAMLVALI